MFYNINDVENYDYNKLSNDLQYLKKTFSFVEITDIGKSVLAKNIYSVKLGNGPRKLSINASHHALEWITTPLIMRCLYNLCTKYQKDSSILNNITIYIIPMLNPDGVDLVINGLSQTNPYYNNLIVWNNYSTNFSYNWKANIRGVDLNHNYNAGWETYKRLEPMYSITGPCEVKYSGPYPHSEPEVRALVEYTKKENFDMVIALHSQGKEIYWNYQNLAPALSYKIVKEFERVSGYIPEANATGSASYGGYKDWFIQEFKKPGFTIECGLGQNPLPITDFFDIYNDLEKILDVAIKMV